MITPIKTKVTIIVVSLTPLCSITVSCLNLANALNEFVYAEAHPFELKFDLILLVNTLFCSDPVINASQSCIWHRVCVRFTCREREITTCIAAYVGLKKKSTDKSSGEDSSATNKKKRRRSKKRDSDNEVEKKKKKCVRIVEPDVVSTTPAPSSEMKKRKKKKKKKQAKKQQTKKEKEKKKKTKKKRKQK